ncbi:MAG TPA: hypothetical protein VL633_08465 [Bacteroidota bacterium]|nr:hypothetical protein [Bacteroidota bacterium]
MTLNIPVPLEFNFLRTVYSHGWCSLPPFSVDKEAGQIHAILPLKSRKIISLQMRSGGAKKIVLETDTPLNASEQEEVAGTVRSCFRLEEKFSEFYAEAMKYPRFRWIPESGSGRMLRAPTVFEDLVKMICTTNCSWALTEIMVANLCTELGEPGGNGKTFPSPEAVADCTEKFLRKKIHAGYRAPYLLELSKRIVNKNVDLEAWRDSSAPTTELFDEVRSVKGVGPYAAGNILKLLGRYDYLGIDSWCRKQFFELHKGGRTVSDRTIGKFYEPFGKWKGLFFWMDVTKHWHSKNLPF